MIKKSTIQLLRFPFAFFLMPVYLFALSQTVYTNWWKAVLVFFILHLLVYPASNGYNSFIDRDESSIGGVKSPLAPTKELYLVTCIMDVLAILMGLFISAWFCLGIIIYILASRAYSSRSIRIKKYPVSGFVLVIICQGALVFWLVYHGVHVKQPLSVPVSGLLGSTFLIAGAYPLTQVYQHEADRRDGVTTISMLLGTRGTFRFSSILFTIAFFILGVHFGLQLELFRFYILVLCFLPVLVYFIRWSGMVWRNAETANYDNLMKMNLISAVCSNIGFMVLLIWKLID